MCLRVTLDRDPRMLTCISLGVHVYVLHIDTCEASLLGVKYKCEVNAFYVGSNVNYTSIVHDL